MTEVILDFDDWSAGYLKEIHEGGAGILAGEVAPVEAHFVRPGRAIAIAYCDHVLPDRIGGVTIVFRRRADPELVIARYEQFGVYSALEHVVAIQRPGDIGGS